MTLPSARLGTSRHALLLPPDSQEPNPAYRQALDWVWSFSTGSRPSDEVGADRALRLPRMHALLAHLGHPERSYPSLLVAGTKGKGSVVAMAASCLTAAGVRTGAYTSPHLVNWRERTCIDGEPIDTQAVLRLVPEVRAAVEALPRTLRRPGTFEVGTALTLLYFARTGVDLAVVEVGVGGREDATNVLDPLVSVITPISYDHTGTLGSTLTAIAEHKAGIMRPGRPAVLGPQPTEALEVIETAARHVRARLVRVGVDWSWRPVAGQPAFGLRSPVEIFDAERTAACRVALPLLGDHQRDNAAAAAAALAELWSGWRSSCFPMDALRRGLEAVDWPGRLQVVHDRPTVVVDGAHNAASALALRRALEAGFRRRSLHLVLGMTEGKDVQGVVGELAPLADSVWLTRSANERAIDPSALKEVVEAVAPHLQHRAAADLSHALEAAIGTADAEDLVVVAGSLFLVGEALVWARQR